MNKSLIFVFQFFFFVVYIEIMLDGTRSIRRISTIRIIKSRVRSPEKLGLWNHALDVTGHLSEDVRS